MKDYKDLIAKLRATKTQSKRKLLDDAADAIEHLQRQLAHKQDVRKQQAETIMELRRERDAAVAELNRLDIDCEVCIHNKKAFPCENTNVLCGDCEHDCYCKDCRENSKWEWRA